MQGLRSQRWSPWAVGVGLGLLSWFAFATVGHGLGITTPFEHTAAIVEQGVLPESATAAYSAKESPKVGWEWMLVAGVFLGSVLSSALSKDRTAPRVPQRWRDRFGESKGKRYVVAFFAGALMMFGARLARGCTSGHGITGTMQLAASSWIFILAAFVVAVATARSLYAGARHV